MPERPRSHSRAMDIAVSSARLCQTSTMRLAPGKGALIGSLNHIRVCSITGALSRFRPCAVRLAAPHADRTLDVAWMMRARFASPLRRLIEDRRALH